MTAVADVAKAVAAPLSVTPFIDSAIWSVLPAPFSAASVNVASFSMTSCSFATTSAPPSCDRRIWTSPPSSATAHLGGESETHLGGEAEPQGERILVGHLLQHERAQ